MQDMYYVVQGAHYADQAEEFESLKLNEENILISAKDLRIL